MEDSVLGLFKVGFVLGFFLEFVKKNKSVLKPDIRFIAITKIILI